MLDAELAVMPREFDELMKELDTSDTGCAKYQVFLDNLYIRQMYLQELVLYNILKNRDTKG